MRMKWLTANTVLPPGVTAENWTDTEGNPAGGVTFGPGFAISWQNGVVLDDSQNGAFVLDILAAVAQRIEYYQTTKFASDENDLALAHLRLATLHLEQRLQRRAAAGTLNTHEVDSNDE